MATRTKPRNEEISDQAAEVTEETTEQATEQATEEGTQAANGEVKKRTYNKPVFADVPDDMLDAAEVPEDEWSSHPLADGPERKPGQVKIDGQVEALHQKWVDAGKPETRQSPRNRLLVDPHHAPAVRYMLGQAATHLKVAVKIAPVAHDQNGKEVIVYTARDKQVKHRKPKATETATETASDAETDS
jgi:hypothetical protein